MALKSRLFSRTFSTAGIWDELAIFCAKMQRVKLNSAFSTAWKWDELAILRAEMGRVKFNSIVSETSLVTALFPVIRINRDKFLDYQFPVVEEETGRRHAGYLSSPTQQHEDVAKVSSR
ncbi:hypothetical protein C5167_025756 [Papaver somniferum]|uniref:Uncharacterized protein n=1 Tax=Papaver somniferum TaxID=3469 RepID=A0A4Y7JVC1_PAPSO|nr:hypothetical protein C5167_025756 [Papaver somniferum]